MKIEYTLAVIFYKVPTQAFLATCAKNLGNSSENSAVGSADGLGPPGREFKSLFSDHIWPIGQSVKSRAFHARGNGSTPL